VSCLRCRDSARTSCKSKLQNSFSLDNAGLYQAWPAPRPSRQDAPRRIKWRQFQQSIFGGLAANWRAMAGKKDKARRYLRWAALNDRRAAEAYNGDLKTLFLQIAAQYRDLAEQIADPEQWQAKRDGRPK
jgi:hypothetical protein